LFVLLFDSSQISLPLSPSLSLPHTYHVDIIPPIDGSTDYVVPLDPLDASSPGTLIIGADGSPMFDFGRIAVGNGATSARWVRDRIKVYMHWG
jgi:hypothetical protein